MTRKLLFAAGTAFALALGTHAPGAAAAEWKFAIEEIKGSVQDAYAQEFAKRIEEKSGGEISVTVYPYGTLGTSADLTELVANGAIQFANASPGHLGTLIPEIQVFSVPYLLSQNDQVNKDVLANSETLYETLEDDFAEQNLELLTMYPEGEMVWTANREIRSPEDFDGFKMRTMVSPMLTEAYQAFGANPTPMPYSEVYGGLQLKQIDGQVNPIFAIQEMKFYEVQDYMIWAGQQTFTTTVVTNNDWYESLSDSQRTMIDETVNELVDFIFETQREFNETRLEKIKESKPELTMIRLTDEERAAFEERAGEAREKFLEMTGESGAEVLNSLEQEIEQAEKKMN